MATKKRSTLRSKSARSNAKSLIQNKINEFKADGGDFHENPLLKLSKVSKKEKQQEKSRQFNESLVHKVTFNTSSSISKSALRRKKRRQKEQLKPKLDDLLSNLPAQTQQDEQTTPTYVAPSRPNANRPNPAKLTGHRSLMKSESTRFHNVLQNQDFRASPFAALKRSIKHNSQH